MVYEVRLCTCYKVQKLLKFVRNRLGYIEKKNYGFCCDVGLTKEPRKCLRNLN